MSETTLDGGSLARYMRLPLLDNDDFADEISRYLTEGRLVVLRDAFAEEFAEEVHRALCATDKWQLTQGSTPFFHYHHHNIYNFSDYPPAVAECARMFDSDATKRLMGRLSGRDCTAPVMFGASNYLPGDHSLPHSDVLQEGDGMWRQVAFIWHLTKEWSEYWGGDLYWCPTTTPLMPQFNSLMLFNVSPKSVHFVTTVRPQARGLRLAINGWWYGVRGEPAHSDAESAPAQPAIARNSGGVEVY